MVFLAYRLNRYRSYLEKKIVLLNDVIKLRFYLFDPFNFSAAALGVVVEVD